MAAYYKLGQDKDYPAVKSVSSSFHNNICLIRADPQRNFHYVTEDTYYNGELVNEHVNVQGDHYKLIREIGAASTILLKNKKSRIYCNFHKQ
jgi:beta-glucosidase